MTVTTTLDRQYFDGDGSNKVFPFNFRFFTNDQIYVSLIAPDGTITPQFLTTNYTLAGALQAGGGTVTMLVAPPLTVPATRVFVQRILPQVQPTSIRNQGKFYPEIHEDVFDRLTMLIQQALAGLNNALQLSANRLGWNFLGFKGINVGNPTDPADAANKQYVDASSSSNTAYVDDQISRTVRAAEVLSPLAPAAVRAGKLMAFDGFGNPVAVSPSSAPIQDAASVLWARSPLAQAITTVHQALDGFSVNLWEFAGLVVSRPNPLDTATWDWSPAIVEANLVVSTMSANGGTIRVPAGTFGLWSTVSITGLGKNLVGEGIRATEFRALHPGTVIQFTGSSYCRAEKFKIVGAAGATQIGLYMPYRVDVGVILQNRIQDVQVELVAIGVALENPVHCSITNLRTTRDNTLYGFRSEFISGVGAGQGGTNLNLEKCWFQASELTGRACYINSNWQPVISGCQFEGAKDGLYLRSVPGAIVTGAQFEDCGQHLTMDGCTNPEFHSPKFDSATSPDLLIATQSVININGGKGAKFYGISSINDSAVFIDFLIRFTDTFNGSYPDDVLIDGYESDGNKGISGDANVPVLRILKGGAYRMQGITLSQLRIQLPIRTSVPASPALGEEFNADGVSWQPVTGGRSRVIYSGAGVYTKIVNF